MIGETGYSDGLSLTKSRAWGWINHGRGTVNIMCWNSLIKQVRFSMSCKIFKDDNRISEIQINTYQWIRGTNVDYQTKQVAVSGEVVHLQEMVCNSLIKLTIVEFIQWQYSSRDTYLPYLSYSSIQYTSANSTNSPCQSGIFDQTCQGLGLLLR